ncbi:MAG: methyltransferase [Oscillospiraceae bacterium]|nr:methyltransferase [Oscillospiraceae bacterium]
MNCSLTEESLGNGLTVLVSPAHRFGTDAFLLAGFAGARHKDRAVDLGTGCGIIPLLLYKKYRPSLIWGVDIQPDAIKQFAGSIALSRLEGVLHPLCSDLKQLKGKLPFDSFDLVTCNPPYEAAGTGFLSAMEAHQIARHEICCTTDDVCAAAFQLLKTGGRLCLCQRPGRMTDVLTAMRTHRLEPKRLRMVMQNPQSKPWLFLAEGKKDAHPGLEVLPPLYMTEPDGSPSRELSQIYGCEAGKDVNP